MSAFQSAKLFLVEAFDLGKDALHIHVGLLVFFGAALLLKVPIRSWRPLLAVVIVALAGELWDIVETFGEGRTPVYGRNWKDVWNTLFWPTALFLTTRYAPALVAPRGRGRKR